jgi:hypothetical protein
MRVVTTAHKAGLEQYGQRWLDSRKNWPKGTEFHWYTEGYELPLQADEDERPIVRKDFAALPHFVEWKGRHRKYKPPNWEFNVVGYAHKVFAAADALYDYDGIGVWLDADCETYRKLPAALIERQIGDADLACYQRTGYHTETGLWLMDCGSGAHREVFDLWTQIYLQDAFKDLPGWTDCHTFDATIRRMKDSVRVTNLSGKFASDMHPQARTEFGKYIDHAKGQRKTTGVSPENKHRMAA